jgi:hypothetical protein
MITFSNILALFIGIWAAVAAVYVAYAAYNILVVLPKYGKLCFGISRNKFIWVSTREYEQHFDLACDNAYREGYRNGLEAHLFNTDADDTDQPGDWEDADFESDITFEDEEEYEEWINSIDTKLEREYHAKQQAIFEKFDYLKDVTIEIEAACVEHDSHVKLRTLEEEMYGVPVEEQKYSLSIDDSIPECQADSGC